jgi:hypothetical protein
MIFENTSCPHLLLHAALPDKTPKYSFLSQNLCGNAAPPHFLAASSHNDEKKNFTTRTKKNQLFPTLLPFSKNPQ